MYLKIRYRARLRDTAEIYAFTDEVEDICRSNGWESHRWDEDWSAPQSVSMHWNEGRIQVDGHAPLKGISLKTGPENETLWLTFTPDGHLNTFFTLQDPTFTAHDAEYPWNRVKVQEGDIRNFVAICTLFRFIAEKYMADLEVMEETGFWQHNDLGKLQRFMDRIAHTADEAVALYQDKTIPPDEKRALMSKLYGIENFQRDDYP